jgi:glucose/arabinose dehydrogenase
MAGRRATLTSAAAGAAVLSAVWSGATPAVAAEGAPGTRLTTLTTGLSLPWDLALLPDGSVLFTERGGRTALRRPNGSLQVVATTQTDLFVGSESGLMGLVVDPGFASNRTYYTCQASKAGGTSPIDIRVLRWQLSTDGTSAARSGAPVLTGIPITTGQHGGCRLRFGADGVLNVGTGDAITGPVPQSLSSLGGKTLRVRTDGTPPADNPFIGTGGNARFVWTTGHRNVQGLALRPGTTQMWSAEHGPDVDDEVNVLVRGGNYGWDPQDGAGRYDQSVPMTDTAAFPSAVRARWSSGRPTVATSGATFLVGPAWGRWEGALAVAELKNTGVRVLSMTPDGRVTGDEQMGPLDGTIGRIRTVQSAGSTVYLTTGNGGGADRIARVAPTPAALPSWSPGQDVSPSGVSAVALGSRVVAFVRGSDGRIWWSSQAAAGGAFSGFHPVAGAVASAPSAVSTDGTSIDLFARNAKGQLVHSRSSGPGYTAWSVVGGSLTSAPSAVSLASGHVDVVARTKGDVLSRARFDGTRWVPWAPLGGTISGAPAASADRAAGTIRVVVRGTSGVLYDKVLTATGTARGFTSLGRTSWSAPGITQGADPLLVSRNDTTPAVVRGAFATAVGGSLTGAPAAVSRSGSSWVLLGRGSDGALWTYDGRPGHYTWSRVPGTTLS